MQWDIHRGYVDPLCTDAVRSNHNKKRSIFSKSQTICLQNCSLPSIIITDNRSWWCVFWRDLSTRAGLGNLVWHFEYASLCIIPGEMSFSVCRPRQQYTLCCCRESWCKYATDMLSALLVLCKSKPPANANLWYFICYSPDVIEMIAAIQIIIYATVRIFNAEKTRLMAQGDCVLTELDVIGFPKITHLGGSWCSLHTTDNILRKVVFVRINYLDYGSPYHAIFGSLCPGLYYWREFAKPALNWTFRNNCMHIMPRV